MKTCTKCKTSKPVNEFTKDKSKKDGLYSQCKPCHKEYYKLNLNKVTSRVAAYTNLNKEHINNYKKNWYKANANRIKKIRQEYQKINSDKIKISRKKYYETNIDKILENTKQYKKNRRAQDFLFKFTCDIRSTIGSAFKRNKTKKYRKSSKTETLLGCTIAELRDHLEKQFQEGMTWKNHGLHGWHVDHRIPLASAKTQEEVEKLCHYTNLQPLWAADNIKKSNKT